MLFTILGHTASILGQEPDPRSYGRPSSTDRSDRIGLPGLEFIRREIRANTFTPSVQRSAVLAMDGRGGFLVVWESRRQEDGNYGVYASDSIRSPADRRCVPRQSYATFCAMATGRGHGPRGWDMDRLGVLRPGRKRSRVLRPEVRKRRDAKTGEIPINRRFQETSFGSPASRPPNGGLVAAWIGPGLDGMGRKAFGGRFDATDIVWASLSS